GLMHPLRDNQLPPNRQSIRRCQHVAVGAVDVDEALAIAVIALGQVEKRIALLNDVTANLPRGLRGRGGSMVGWWRHRREGGSGRLNDGGGWFRSRRLLSEEEDGQRDDKPDADYQTELGVVGHGLFSKPTRFAITRNYPQRWRGTLDRLWSSSRFFYLAWRK